MELNEISEKLQKVSDLYAERFQIKRGPDWFVLKIQEELGELVASHLKLTGRGRMSNSDLAALELNLEDEIADVLAMTLLFAKHKKIDALKVIQRKWLSHLE